MHLDFGDNTALPLSDPLGYFGVDSQDIENCPSSSFITCFGFFLSPPATMPETKNLSMIVDTMSYTF